MNDATQGAVQRSRIVGLLGVLVATAGTALLGHAGSGATGSLVASAAVTLHMLATGCWMGTLGVTMVLVLGRRLSRVLTRTVLVQFAGVATLSVGVMAATGLLLASDVVGSLDALLLTDYGRLLMVKVAVVGILLVLGLTTHVRLRRAARPVGRLVAVEALGGVLVLLVTGALTSGQPALERQLMVDPATPASTTVYQQISDLHESLSIRPNRPGENMALLRVTDTRRPSPGRVIGVQLVVVDASGSFRTEPATPLDDSQWSVPVTLSESGPVAVHTVVERQGLPATTGEVTWTTGWAPDTPPALVSRTPLQPLLEIAAWVAFTLVVLIGLLTALRLSARQIGRRPSSPKPGKLGTDRLVAGRREG